jgi:hypothetical protein
MKNPENQNQHKLPQVYLRQFGYKHKEQWKVSTKVIGENFVRQKSIESFLSEINVFKIDSDQNEIQNIFEEFNCLLEDEFLRIISDLDNNGQLSEKSQAYIYQLIPNLLVRTDIVRNLVRELLESDARTNFLTIICIHKADSLESLHKMAFFKMLNEPNVDESIINKALIFFADHFFRKLAWYEIVILKSQENKPWFTSDNPIILKNRKQKFNFMTNQSEVYFPLNPSYIIYLHHKESTDSRNKFRKYEKNKIYEVNNRDNILLQRKIMLNLDKHLIITGEYKVKAKLKKRKS